MDDQLLEKMTPGILHKILAYFDLLLRLGLIDDTSHSKAKDRIIDLVMNNM